MTSREQIIKEWLARKEAKGTLGDRKPNDWNGEPVYTGFCPCKCGHKYMIECDPDIDNCLCCDEVCS